MNTNNKLTEELIYLRARARIHKDWKQSDELRYLLDARGVYVFDTKDGQDIHYTTESYFKFKDKSLETMAMSRRQYVEYIIKRDIKAEKHFSAWLFSIQSK